MRGVIYPAEKVENWTKSSRSLTGGPQPAVRHQGPLLAPGVILFFIFALQRALESYKTWPKRRMLWLENADGQESGSKPASCGLEEKG